MVLDWILEGKGIKYLKVLMGFPLPSKVKFDKFMFFFQSQTYVLGLQQTFTYKEGFSC
jgi:hypothetical protein